MAQKNIGTGWTRDSRNAMNDNFDELYAGFIGAGKSMAEAERLATEAVNTAKAAKVESALAKKEAESTQDQLDRIVIDSGTSDAETIQARGEFPVLNDRLNSVTTSLAETDEDLTLRGLNIESFRSFVQDGDWTEAIRQACTILKSSGGGTLIFPNVEYEILKESLYPSIDGFLLYDFGDTGNIHFDFRGTLKVNRIEPLSTVWEYFRFEGAKNIRLTGLHHDSPNARIHGGAVVLKLFGACENVTTEDITGSGINRLIQARGSGYDDVPHQEGVMKNIVAKNVQLEGCYKPFTLTFGVKGVHIENYHLQDGHRAIHLYGVEDVYIRASASECDANAFLFTSYYTLMELGIRNANIHVSSDGKGSSAANLVAFNYTGNGEERSAGYRGLFESIRLHADVGKEEGFGAVAILTNYINDNPVELDTLPKGHVFKDVKISGSLSEGSKRFASISGLLEGDHMENITLENIDSSGTTTSTVHAYALKNNSLTLDNIISKSGNFRINAVPAGQQAVFKNSTIRGGSTDESPVLFVNSNITRSVDLVITNKEFINTFVESEHFVSNVKPKPNNQRLRWYDMFPQVLARKEYLDLDNVPAHDIVLTFPNKGSFFSPRAYEPNIFRFSIGFQNAGESVICYISGDIMLRKNSTSSSELQDAMIVRYDKVNSHGTSDLTLSARVTSGDLVFSVVTTEGQIDRIGGVVLI